MYESVTLTLISIDPNPYFYLIKIRVRVTLSYIRNYPLVSISQNFMWNGNYKIESKNALFFSKID